MFSRSQKLVVMACLTLVLVSLAGIEWQKRWIRDAVSEFATDFHYRASQGFFRADQLEAARKEADAALHWDPDQPYVQHLKFQILKALGQPEEAKRWLRKSITRDEKISPDSPPRWRVELGYWELLKGDMKAVDELLATLSGRAAKAAGAPILRAARQRQKGKLAPAESLARRLIADFYLTRYGEVYRELALIAAERKDYRQAAYLGLEGIRHGGAGDLEKEEKAVLNWSRLAGVDPLATRSFLKALRLRGLGPSPDKVDLKGAEVADGLLAHLLKKEPDFFARDLALHSRGSYWYYQKKDYAKALKHYQKAVRATPTGAVGCRCRFQIFRCYEEEKDLPEAEKAAYKVMKACPGDLALRASDRLRRLKKRIEQDTP